MPAEQGRRTRPAFLTMQGEPQRAVMDAQLARSGCFGTHGSRPAFVLACASRASRLCDRLCPEVATPASGSNAHIVTAQPGEQQSPTGIADDSVGDCGSRDRPVRCRRQGPPLPMHGLRISGPSGLLDSVSSKRRLAFEKEKPGRGGGVAPERRRAEGTHRCPARSQVDRSPPGRKDDAARSTPARLTDVPIRAGLRVGDMPAPPTRRVGVPGDREGRATGRPGAWCHSGRPAAGRLPG